MAAFRAEWPCGVVFKIKIIFEFFDKICGPVLRGDVFHPLLMRF